MINPFRSIAIFFVFFTTTIVLSEQNYWQQSVDYKMEIVLLDSVRQLACKSTITYKNNSPYTLHNVYT